MPTIGQQIASLRLKMDLNQNNFAKYFGVSAMAVSRWERNVNEPSARELIRLGLLARQAGLDGWAYWDLAGITQSDARAALPPKARVGASRR